MLIETGRTRFSRLIHIGTSSSYLSFDALKAATSEAKSSHDPTRYEQAVTLLGEAAPEDLDAVPDMSWIEKTRHTNKVNTDKMELELKGYKNNLIKESIRVGSTNAAHRPKLIIMARWATKTWESSARALVTFPALGNHSRRCTTT